MPCLIAGMIQLDEGTQGRVAAMLLVHQHEAAIVSKEPHPVVKITLVGEVTEPGDGPADLLLSRWCGWFRHFGPTTLTQVRQYAVPGSRPKQKPASNAR